MSVASEASVEKPILPLLRMSPKQAQRVKMLRDLDAQTLLISEVYASIQGESTFAGLPCTFVRLTGCHLRCRWCDTPHSFKGGDLLDVSQVVEQVDALTPRLMEITGGEPLAQPAVYPLMKELAETGFTVLLETSGSLSTEHVDPRVVVILDLKCPGSGEVDSNDWSNIDRLKLVDEVKFVVADQADFDWAVSLIRKKKLDRFKLLMAPVFGELEYEPLCRWIVESGLPIRFQPQMHKHVWDPAKRGV